jgi:hypothetical protein
LWFRPDGRYVVGRVSSAQQTYELFDLTTGGARPLPCDGQFAGPDVLVCATATSVMTVRLDGTVLTNALLQGDFAGRHFLTSLGKR